MPEKDGCLHLNQMFFLPLVLPKPVTLLTELVFSFPFINFPFHQALLPSITIIHL